MQSAEFISKIEGSLQEIEETGYWLELLVGSKTLSDKQVETLANEADELTAMLAASARTAKRRKP